MLIIFKIISLLKQSKLTEQLLKMSVKLWMKITNIKGYKIVQFIVKKVLNKNQVKKIMKTIEMKRDQDLSLI